MAHAREQGGEPARGVVRARGPARGRGDDDAGYLPVALAHPRVTLYHAADCRLCARALEVVQSVRDELGFELTLVDVTGDPALEARYREQLPVVEIEGERAFAYFIDRDALRARILG